VEIDSPNQKMTYVKDNEVLVSTDVVTGATWGYPTPPGLYKVENKDTNCWLSGEDYNVHVDYWIGFVGYTIGIHDADWRTKFGGTNYVRNGSHVLDVGLLVPVFQGVFRLVKLQGANLVYPLGLLYVKFVPGL
ncbi:MAG: L,D-transpeptidase, partial [Fibrobacter sp.]|nr:L,D-transpeptidase [Fibrobacter sp.]